MLFSIDMLAAVFDVKLRFTVHRKHFLKFK